MKFLWLFPLCMIACTKNKRVTVAPLPSDNVIASQPRMGPLPPLPAPIPENGVASLSFSIDATGSSADCPQLKSLKKEENQFGLIHEPMGDFAKAGVTQEWVQACVIKGAVLVPAGYIVGFDVQERIGAVDYTLEDNDQAAFRLDLASTLDGKEFLTRYEALKQGPLTAFDEPQVFERITKDQVSVSCDDSKDAPRQLSFVARFSYRMNISTKSSGDGGALASKLPILQFKPKKCDPLAPNAPSIAPVGPVMAAAFSFEVDEVATQKSCAYIDAFEKSENRLGVKIRPISTELKDPDRLASKDCVVHGRVVIPAKHVLSLKPINDPIKAQLDIDADSKVVLRYESRLFSSENPVEVKQQLNQNGPLKAEQNLLLPPLKAPAEEDCAKAKAENSTALFEVALTQQLARQIAPKTPMTSNLFEFPAVQFQLKACP